MTNPGTSIYMHFNPDEIMNDLLASEYQLHMSCESIYSSVERLIEWKVRKVYMVSLRPLYHAVKDAYTQHYFFPIFNAEIMQR